MVQFYPKAVTKSYWKRMDAESQDFPREACLTFGGPAVSLLRVNDLTTVFGIVGAAPFARSSRKGLCEEGAREAGKFNPDLFVFASTASARVPGSSRSLL
jgi:hypothetical protein